MRLSVGNTRLRLSIPLYGFCISGQPREPHDNYCLSIPLYGFFTPRPCTTRLLHGPFNSIVWILAPVKEEQVGEEQLSIPLYGFSNPEKYLQTVMTLVLSIPLYGFILRAEAAVQPRVYLSIPLYGFHVAADRGYVYHRVAFNSIVWIPPGGS